MKKYLLILLSCLMIAQPYTVCANKTPGMNPPSLNYTRVEDKNSSMMVDEIGRIVAANPDLKRNIMEASSKKINPKFIETLKKSLAEKCNPELRDELMEYIGKNPKIIETVKKAYSNNSEKSPSNPIYPIYKRLYSILKFDQPAGDILKKLPRNISVKERFEIDVNAMNNSERKGMCRQIAHKLIYELHKIGVWARPIIIRLSNGESHISTLYEFNHRYFVADLAYDIQHNMGGYLSSLPVRGYMETLSGIDFQVLAKYPGDITKPLDNSDFIPLSSFAIG